LVFRLDDKQERVEHFLLVRLLIDDAYIAVT
jgi:hypothetical protein